jgi:hypothetical protein
MGSFILTDHGAIANRTETTDVPDIKQFYRATHVSHGANHKQTKLHLRCAYGNAFLHDQSCALAQSKRARDQLDAITPQPTFAAMSFQKTDHTQLRSVD